MLSCSLIGPSGNFGVGAVKLYVAANLRRLNSMLHKIDPDFLANNLIIRMSVIY